jgi:hypothetical protein
MARILKQDHAKILHLADVEKRKVADIAADYGCKPANIHALLGKLRRTAQEQEKVSAGPEPAPEAPPVAAIAEAAPAADLFAAAEGAQSKHPMPPTIGAQPATQDRAEEATVTVLPRGKRAGIGAALAKPGFGLTMRTAEGDESLTPFRSLEDLLSAVKPILRACAKNPEAVWFSIKPVDLSALEFDAA